MDAAKGGVGCGREVFTFPLLQLLFVQDALRPLHVLRLRCSRRVFAGVTTPSPLLAILRAARPPHPIAIVGGDKRPGSGRQPSLADAPLRFGHDAQHGTLRRWRSSATHAHTAVNTSPPSSPAAARAARGAFFCSLRYRRTTALYTYVPGVQYCTFVCPVIYMSFMSSERKKPKEALALAGTGPNARCFGTQRLYSRLQFSTVPGYVPYE